MKHLQQQIIHLESEAEKIQEIRSLEKEKKQMIDSQEDLQRNVCQNCIGNYQLVEETQLKYNEAARKAQRLEEMLNNQSKNEG